MNSKPQSKSAEEIRKDIIRRAHESMTMGNQQAVRECRAQLAALTGKGR